MTSPSLIDDKGLVESELRDLLNAASGAANRNIVHEAERYAVLGHGKRIRPILAIRIARMTKAENRYAARVAAAVELIHCASLIIDDLPCMDGAWRRRGAPSVHAAFGESTAILAAFGLVMLAARSVADPLLLPCATPRLRTFQIHLLQAVDSNGLIDGQALDLQLPHYDPSLRSPACPETNGMKTAPLFSLAVRAGCVFARIEPRVEEILLGFGFEFGKAFQIRDDLVDGDAATGEMLARQLTKTRDMLSVFGNEAAELTELVDLLHVASPANGTTETAGCAINFQPASEKEPRSCPGFQETAKGIADMNAPMEPMCNRSIPIRD
jgi:geranylgeranyl pyrophosphate synthase